MNANIDPQNEFRNEATVRPDEVYIDEQLPYDGGGWPGDGSGTDDLADFNANEAMDYSGE